MDIKATTKYPYTTDIGTSRYQLRLCLENTWVKENYYLLF